MKKKIIILLIFWGFVSVIIHIYNMNFNNEIIENKNNINTNMLSIMLETDLASNQYESSADNKWPGRNYLFNEALSYCENGSKIIWDSDSGNLTLSTKYSDKCYLYFDKKEMFAKDIILANNNGPIKTNPDFSKPATTDEGLYKAEDDLGTSYYFRGAVKNNYVKFGETLWRIIRINGDGTIRIIYESSNEDNFTCSSSPSSNVYLRVKSIPTLGYNVGYAAVGWCYSQTGDYISDSPYGTTPSEANIYLNEWYSNWINTYPSVKEYIANSLFCNEMSVEGVMSTDFYAGNYHISQNAPQLKCNYNKYASSSMEVPENITLLAYINTSLEYPVGLITADEVNMAGGSTTNTNKNYYLYTGYPYYTMTLQGNPSGCSSGSSSILDYLGTDYFLVDENGRLSNATGEYYLRPVINLKAEDKFSGNGTIGDPYMVIG